MYGNRSRIPERCRVANPRHGRSRMDGYLFADSWRSALMGKRRGSGERAQVPVSMWPPCGSGSSELVDGRPARTRFRRQRACRRVLRPPRSSGDGELAGGVQLQPPRYSGDGELVGWGCQRQARLIEKEHIEEDCRVVEHDDVLPIKFSTQLLKLGS